MANEEDILNYLTMTVEPGIIGGMPLGGMDFGAAINGEAVISMPDQFDFYDGGGLDLTCLGFAQCDSRGNVNSSKFGPRVAGCGGFINISQNTKRVLFLGTFTTGGIKVAVEDGKVRILKEGKIKKFVGTSEQITFCSMFADSQNQEILYITERCVFKFTKGALELIEIAPGIDIDKDILAQMDFKPKMNHVAPMDPRLFQKLPMGIRGEFLLKELRTRVHYIPETNTLQLNFNGLELETREDVDNIQKVVEETCLGVGRKVKAIINYNGFRVDDNLFDAYMEMGHSIINKHYLKVARHNTNDETRSKFEAEYHRRNLEANIFSSRDEAVRFLIQD